MIEIKNLIKTYHDGKVETPVLKDINFSIEDGEFVAIMGRSGAGKSTLLYQISLLDHPSSGDIIIDGVNATDLSSDDRTKYRLHKLGYVFQDYALLPDLTALENVALPLIMQGKTTEHAYSVAKKALDRVNLGHRPGNLPSQLSGGEQQRVSVARAIAHKPKILFADEPTANLDTESSRVVIDLFKELHKEGQTIIMVTHEEEYGKMTERTIRLSDGKVVEDRKNR